MSKSTVAAVAFVAFAVIGAVMWDRPEPPGTAPTEEAARAQRHAESMKKWYAENPEVSQKPENYLDSRSGPALERTVRRAIDMAGYECGSVRSTRQEAGRVAVDCGADGSYLITEAGADIRVLKR